MIISHRHQFIFIKTHKTAGTAIEIALSRFCGPQDVITPISAVDEETRKQLGYQGAQNFHVESHYCTWLDRLHSLRRGKEAQFYNHVPAIFVQRRVDPSIWDDYYKFCFERNPWDKAISLFYWRKYVNEYDDVSDFIHSRKARRIRDWTMYTSASGIMMDKIYKYEEMNSALDDIRARLGLPETPVLPDAKTGHKSDKRHYRDVLGSRDRARIAKLCAPEIAQFGYAW